MSPLLVGTSMLGTVDPATNLAHLNTVVGTFFDVALRGESPAALEGLALPGVIVSARNVPRRRNLDSPH